MGASVGLFPNGVCVLAPPSRERRKGGFGQSQGPMNARTLAGGREDYILHTPTLVWALRTWIYQIVILKKPIIQIHTTHDCLSRLKQPQKIDEATPFSLLFLFLKKNWKFGNAVQVGTFILPLICYCKWLNKRRRNDASLIRQTSYEAILFVTRCENEAKTFHE
jgi:hypothetical protein